MPYTIAHIGYSIGLKKKWISKLSLNGLIFGSIVPDFDILFRFTNQRFHLFAFDLFTIFIILLPLSLVLSIFFHQFIRDTVIELLPKTFRDKTIPYQSYDYIGFLKRSYKWEILSILIGISVHFGLDLFSHWNAWLYMMIIHVGIYPCHFLVPFHYYFGWYFPQVLATFFGFYLMYLYLLTPKNTISMIKNDILNAETERKLVWVGYFVIAILFGVLKLFVFGYEGNGYAWHSVIIHLTSGLIFSFFITPLLYKLIKIMSSKS